MDYRFGFNGKENDGEWGTSLVQDYGFRLYNPGIAKFLSVDPLAPEYPWYTPYQFAGNMPIWAIDLDGLEPKGYRHSNYGGRRGLTLIQNRSTKQNSGREAKPIPNDVIVAAAEIGLGVTPAGWAVDAKDVYVAYSEGDGWGLFFAGVGFIPIVGDLAKNARKAHRAGTTIEIATEQLKHVDDISVSKPLVGTGPLGGETGDGLKKLKDDINPEGGNFNCVQCAIALEKKITQRINAAVKRTGKADANYGTTIREAFPGTKKYYAYGGSKVLVNTLDQVKGNSAIIIGHYKSKYVTEKVSAHAFNAVRNSDGSWKYLDAQSGKQYSREDIDNAFSRFDVFDTKDKSN